MPSSAPGHDVPSHHNNNGNDTVNNRTCEHDKEHVPSILAALIMLSKAIIGMSLHAVSPVSDQP